MSVQRGRVCPRLDLRDVVCIPTSSTWLVSYSKKSRSGFRGHHLLQYTTTSVSSHIFLGFGGENSDSRRVFKNGTGPSLSALLGVWDIVSPPRIVLVEKTRTRGKRTASTINDTLGLGEAFVPAAIFSPPFVDLQSSTPTFEDAWPQSQAQSEPGGSKLVH